MKKTGKKFWRRVNFCVSVDHVKDDGTVEKLYYRAPVKDGVVNYKTLFLIESPCRMCAWHGNKLVGFFEPYRNQNNQ